MDELLNWIERLRESLETDKSNDWSEELSELDGILAEQTVPAFRPEGEPDEYREIDSRLVTTTGTLDLYLTASYGTHSGPITVSADQARRILEMLSSEAQK